MTGWDGEDYRRVNTLQQWLATRALEDVDLDGVRSLLDVGCGDGRVTEQLAARIPDSHCVGLDPSPGMVAVAPSRPGLAFEVGDVGAMTFVDEFDLVVSFNALHGWPDNRQRCARSRPHCTGRDGHCSSSCARGHDRAWRTWR